MGELFVGVDLGGTNIKAGLVDRSGHLLNKTSIPTEVEKGRNRILDNIASVARDSASGLPWDDIGAGGVGSPGPLDHRRGIVWRAANLGDWKDVHLADEIASRLSLPVFVENDANVACWGESWVGAAAGYGSAVLFTLGTGVGGGIVLDRHLWRGACGTAGELGHMVMEFDGERCSCGGVGCLEAYASATATVRRFLRFLAEGRSSSLAEAAKTGEITTEVLFDAAREGDETARDALVESAKYLGAGVASVANALNPDIILIGGGMSGAADIILPVLREEVSRRIFEAVFEKLVIERAALGNDAGVIGAAGCAMERFSGGETT